MVLKSSKPGSNDPFSHKEWPLESPAEMPAITQRDRQIANHDLAWPSTDYVLQEHARHWELRVPTLSDDERASNRAFLDAGWIDYEDEVTGASLEEYIQ